MKEEGIQVFEMVESGGGRRGRGKEEGEEGKEENSLV